MKRAAPAVFDRAPRILTCFRPFAKVREIRIERALHRDLALANGVLNALEATLATKAPELRVRIKDERRPAEAARDARTVRVQPDYKIGKAAVAEGEHWVVAIIAYGRVPLRIDVIAFVQALQLRPQARLERELGARRAIWE